MGALEKGSGRCGGGWTPSPGLCVWVCVCVPVCVPSLGQLLLAGWSVGEAGRMQLKPVLKPCSCWGGAVVQHLASSPSSSYLHDSSIPCSVLHWLLPVLSLNLPVSLLTVSLPFSCTVLLNAFKPFAPQNKCFFLNNFSTGCTIFGDWCEFCMCYSPEIHGPAWASTLGETLDKSISEWQMRDNHITVILHTALFLCEKVPSSSHSANFTEKCQICNAI